MSNKPNILFLMSDEHDPGVTGCYGDPVAYTPNLDTLAERGVTFDSCYTTSPLCAPARLSFTAGKYISRIGAWDNSSLLPSADYTSLPRILNAVGYESFLCGKMQYDPVRRYGFSDLLPGVRNNSYKIFRGRRKPDDTSVGRANWAGRTSKFYVGDHSMVMDGDRLVTEACCEFLESRKARDKPFFLTVGHLAPHFPLIVPQKYYDI